MRYIIVLVLTLAGLKLQADDSIRILECNPIVREALVDFIDAERDKSYFTDSLILNVHIHFWRNDTIIQLSSIGNKIAKERSHLGCFILNGHKVVVSGKRIVNELFLSTPDYYGNFYTTLYVKEELIELDEYNSISFVYKFGRFYDTEF